VETIPESGLDAVLFQVLYPRTDAEDTQLEIDLSDLGQDDEDVAYYAAFELESDEDTGTFVRLRDTSHDHVVTVEFPFAALGAETLPVPRVEVGGATCQRNQTGLPVRRIALGTPAPPLRTVAEDPPVYSAPYAKLDIAPSFEDAMPFPVESLPFERVELELFHAPKRPHQETQIIERGSSVVTVIAVLSCALALGLSAVLLIVR
jgi:hypothetical protein